MITDAKKYTAFCVLWGDKSWDYIGGYSYPA